MAKYISCEDAQKIICGWCGVCQNPTLEDLEKCDDICPQFAKIPAADVRPVVLCRDCIHARHYTNKIKCGYWSEQTTLEIVCEDDFCSYGEKREET